MLREGSRAFWAVLLRIARAPHLLMMASTMTWMGLLSVRRWMISHVLRTISACSARARSIEHIFTLLQMLSSQSFSSQRED